MGILNFFGDVYLPAPVPAVVPLRGEYVLNLESPLTRASRPVPGKINLKVEGLHFQATFGRNPVAICLANNHIMDHGAAGLQDTVEALAAAGIACFGAGRLAENCRNPLLLASGGKLLALLGYVCATSHPVLAAGDAPGAAGLDPERITADMRRARAAGAERVIVQLHWGEEHVGLPRPVDVAIAHAIIDAGADLIIGHHAHCIQPFEIYRGRPVFYGLGNTIFPNTVMESYAPDGRPLANRQMPWREQNRRSLAVEYDSDTGAVAVRLLRFKDALTVVPGIPPQRRFTAGARAQARYRLEYGWVLRWSMLRRLGASFLSRPRLPRKENLGWLADLFRTKKKG
ncbi:MAG: CapA family protein [Acidobacteria bacterium]|nr:CapA family protein [Acidobacteriota bacterium]